MQCLQPIRIRHPTEKGEFLDVPCGKCVACLSRRRQSWVFRLKQELNYRMSALFITLTYDDSHLPWGDEEPILHKPDLQKFFKRLRKYIKKNFDEPVSLRYYAVGEYGSTTHRPHYHAILFNFPLELNILDALKNTWSLGLFHVGNVTDKSINYVAKYVLCKTEFAKKEIPPFMVCSKSIGEEYLTPENIKYHKDGLKGFVILPSGARVSLPRYYKVRIFTDAERLEITKDLKEWLVDKELEYQRKYARTDELALQSGTAMIKSQMLINKVQKIENKITKGRKL